MTGFNFLTAVYLIGAVAAGACGAWVLRSRQSAQRLKQMELSWLARLKKSEDSVEELKAEVDSLQEALQTGEAALQKHMVASKLVRDEYNAASKKFVVLQNELSSVTDERDRLENRIANHEKALASAQQKNAELQAEFNSIQEIGKAKLSTVTEERKALQRKLEDSKSEQQSLNNLLMAARFEHESVSKLLAATQSKQRGVTALEEKISAIQAENVKLQHEAALANREAELIRRDVDELSSLRDQNSQLTRCLASMDKSRKQYEEDAMRYRNQYENSEKESDTLRFMLGDIGKSWAKMHDEDMDDDKRSNGKLINRPPIFLDAPDGEIDDLMQIIGIGRVFEKALHDIGVFHFRQIAAFGPAEISHINSALKEFKGRMENDDWIGQATALQFKKYGTL